MQSVSSRIWTRVTVSISYDDNHYTTGTSSFFYGLQDGREEAVKLLFCCALIPGFVQNSMQYSYLVPIMCFFLQTFI